jgi:hypothetical protein
MKPEQSTTDLNTDGLRILAKIIARDMLKTSMVAKDISEPELAHPGCTLRKRTVSNKNAKEKRKS